MAIFKNISIAVGLFISINLCALAQPPRAIPVNQDAPKGSHIDAVGAVFTIEGKTASIGTGTYIGDQKILTAGHLFKSILPPSIPQQSGPVTIDVSDKRVFWSNEVNLDLSIPPSVLYRVKQITVDARFINFFNSQLTDPDQDDVKTDMAILTLEKPVKNIKEVSIPRQRSEMPTEGLLVGYGKDSVPGHRKKSNPQALHGLLDMGEWGILMSNISADMQKNPLELSDVEDKQMEVLLGKNKLDPKDIKITRATQGDSGGPLLVVTHDQQIFIIGVMSANSKVFNAFASLVVKTPSGYFRSSHLDDLLNAAK